MIRRTDDGHWVLIRQDDHARLAGDLARQFGNNRFEPSEPWESVVTAAGMHDAGWPLHDDEPTLNSLGEPLDVFETPPSIAVRVWSASADRAAAGNPYAGLLVSLHVLALSTRFMSGKPAGTPPALQEKFAINQFQHREVERQESLRRGLGLPTDIPLHYGLAKQGLDPREDRLAAHLRLLQAMDAISLAICGTPPSPILTCTLHSTTGERVELHLTRDRIDQLTIDPWPFAQDAIEFQMPARRLPIQPLTTPAALREALSGTRAEVLNLRIRPA